MKTRFYVLFCVLLVMLAGVSVVSAARPIGGDQGWYEVMCNVNGATVYFNNQNVGQIQDGVLYVPVYTTGTPYTTYSVSMPGYSTYTGTINSVPGKGDFVTLYATLNPLPTAVPTTQMAPIGGDMGYYQVFCNIDGATVFFDTTNEGQISQGSLTVPVYVTGTPFKTYSVQMPGYATFSAPITEYPAKGETVKLFATLNPLITTAPTPTATKKAPLPVEICVLAMLIGGLGVILSGRKH